MTGSAFTQLVSYWKEVLKKDAFFAKQLSARGGEVYCQLKGERVEIRGEVFGGDDRSVILLENI